METRLSMSVMQNLLATCWVSLDMNILILQYKCTFSLYIYVMIIVIISRCQDILFMDESVSVTLQYLHKKHFISVSGAPSPTLSF